MDNLFKNKFRIDSTRLKGWDYSSGAYYFITICVKGRESLLGQIKNGEMVLSEIGVAAEKCWIEIPDHFPFVKPDEHVIMPNHVHGIIVINRNDGVETQFVERQDFASLQYRPNPNRFGPQSKNLGSIIRGFKIGVKKWTIKNNVSFEWQQGFYDRIVRNEKELCNVRNYILNNPLKWEKDKNLFRRDGKC